MKHETTGRKTFTIYYGSRSATVDLEDACKVIEPKKPVDLGVVVRYWMKLVWNTYKGISPAPLMVMDVDGQFLLINPTQVISIEPNWDEPDPRTPATVIQGTMGYGKTSSSAVRAAQEMAAHPKIGYAYPDGRGLMDPPCQALVRNLDRGVSYWLLGEEGNPGPDGYHMSLEAFVATYDLSKGVPHGEQQTPCAPRCIACATDEAH